MLWAILLGGVWTELLIESTYGLFFFDQTLFQICSKWSSKHLPQGWWFNSDEFRGSPPEHKSLQGYFYLVSKSHHMIHAWSNTGSSISLRKDSKSHSDHMSVSWDSRDEMRCDGVLSASLVQRSVFGWLILLPVLLVFVRANKEVWLPAFLKLLNNSTGARDISQVLPCISKRTPTVAGTICEYR